MVALVQDTVCHRCLLLRVRRYTLSLPLCIPRWSIAVQTILSNSCMSVHGDASSIRSLIALPLPIVLSSVGVEDGVLRWKHHHYNSGSNLGWMVSRSLPTSMGFEAKPLQIGSLSCAILSIC